MRTSWASEGSRLLKCNETPRECATSWNFWTHSVKYPKALISSLLICGGESQWVVGHQSSVISHHSSVITHQSSSVISHHSYHISIITHQSSPTTQYASTYLKQARRDLVEVQKLAHDAECVVTGAADVDQQLSLLGVLGRVHGQAETQIGAVLVDGRRGREEGERV